MKQTSGASAPPAPDQLQLAWKRTYLACERTLMAWMRTAISLIAFGFTLYKFFEFLRETQPELEPHRTVSPRLFGLLMMGIGVFVLIVATWQHRLQMKELRSHYGQAPISLSAILAALIGILGLLGFVAGLLRQ